MVVSLYAGRDAVRAYVAEQAALGLDHVYALVKADRDAMVAMIEDLGEDEAQVSPGADEYSAPQVIEHLNASFTRSIERLSTLSSGRPWSATGPAPSRGGLPEESPPSFAETRRRFIEGEDGVLAVLKAVEGTKGLDLTADHADFGPFNWLQWAVYSHHVHTSDHLGQVAALRELILSRR